MRISNNNVNEEEKEYWSEYGTKIFEYSYNFHRNGEELEEVRMKFITDYLATSIETYHKQIISKLARRRHFFKTLVFSKDDCAEFG